MLKKAKKLFNEIITEYGKEVKGVKIQTIQLGYGGDFIQNAIIEVLENDGLVHEYNYFINGTPKNNRKDAIVYAKRIMKNLEKTYKPTHSIGWEILDNSNIRNPFQKY